MGMHSFRMVRNKMTRSHGLMTDHLDTRVSEGRKNVARRVSRSDTKMSRQASVWYSRVARHLTKIEGGYETIISGVQYLFYVHA